LIKALPPAFTAKDKEIKALKEGPLAKVEAELAEVQRSLETSRKGKASKEEILRDLQSVCDSVTRELEELRRETDEWEVKINEAEDDIEILEAPLEETYHILQSLFSDE
jgi:septal ring factor EnvC (AmiA/AmiB activator)